MRYKLGEWSQRSTKISLLKTVPVWCSCSINICYMYKIDSNMKKEIDRIKLHDSKDIILILPLHTLQSRENQLRSIVTNRLYRFSAR